MYVYCINPNKKALENRWEYEELIILKEQLAACPVFGEERM